MSAGDGSSSSSHGERFRDFVRAPSVEPPPPMPKPGDRVGRFVVGERLGSGASGVVFTARDVVLDRDVALKILALDPASSRERILREARAAAKLVHPGVALVHDVIEREEGLALVLERVLGKTLRDALREGPFPERRAARVVAQAARAVHAAHEVGVIHRDLKPENMMITRDDRVKLLDFGLATPRDGVHRRTAGTAGYVAPEAASGEVGPKADLYALGVVLVELVTGARSGELGQLTPGLRRIAQRASAEDPAHRFTTGNDLSKALEAFAGRSRWGARVERLSTLLFGVASLSWPSATSEYQATPMATTGPILVRRVACPQLETTARDRWLGAATANLVCRAARLKLGGARATAIPPAELLSLPSTPSERFSRDVFQAVEARARAVERATELARDEPGLVWIDGSVERVGSRFRVTLTLGTASDVESRSAEGSLVEASHEAARLLFDEPRVVRLEASDPDAGDVVHEPELRDALAFGHASTATGGSARAARERLLPFQALSAEAAAMIEHLAMNLGEARGAAEARSVDRTSDATFAISASLHAELGGAEPARELAREAAERREHSEGRARLSLVRAEALLRLLAEERDLARSLALAAAQADAWDAPWGVLAHASYGRPEWGTLSRAHTAWMPESADAWNIAAHVDANAADKGELLERAFTLSDHFPLYAGNYGMWLLSMERLDEARAIIAQLRVGSQGQRAAAVRLSLELAWAEGRVFGGFDDTRSALFELPTIGSIESGDIAIVANLVELGVLLGRASEVPDEIVSTFVDVEPPRLDRGPFARQTIAHACAYASDAAARRCFAKLRALEARGFFPMRDTGEPAHFIEGAQAFSEGRMIDAARAFRAIQTEPGLHAGLVGRAFAATGDTARANAVDPVKPGSRRGTSMSHLRAAMRAAGANDCSALQVIAPPVRAALEGIDGDLPALAELRRAVARCEQR